MLLADPALPERCARRKLARRCGSSRRRRGRERTPQAPPGHDRPFRMPAPSWTPSSPISSCSGATTSTRTSRRTACRPFAVLAYDSVDVQPWERATRAAENSWDEPEDKDVHDQGHRAAGKFIASALLNEGFDIAYAYKPLRRGTGPRVRELRAVPRLGPQGLSLSGRAVHRERLRPRPVRAHGRPQTPSEAADAREPTSWIRRARSPGAASSSAPPSRGRRRRARGTRGPDRLVELVPLVPGRQARPDVSGRGIRPRLLRGAASRATGTPGAT